MVVSVMSGYIVSFGVVGISTDVLWISMSSVSLKIFGGIEIIIWLEVRINVELYIEMTRRK